MSKRASSSDVYEPASAFAPSARDLYIFKLLMRYIPATMCMVTSSRSNTKDHLLTDIEIIFGDATCLDDFFNMLQALTHVLLKENCENFCLDFFSIRQSSSSVTRGLTNLISTFYLRPKKAASDFFFYERFTWARTSYPVYPDRPPDLSYTFDISCLWLLPFPTGKICTYLASC